MMRTHKRGMRLILLLLIASSFHADGHLPRHGGNRE